MGLELKQFTVLLPKILKKPSILFNEPRVLAEAIPMFGFLAPFAQLFTGPFLMNLEYKHKGRDASERKLLVMQELVSQCVTVSAHILSFIAGGMIARKILPGINPRLFIKDSIALKDGETLACLLGGFVGGTFFRPFLSAYAVNRFSPAEKNSPAKSSGLTAPSQTPVYKSSETPKTQLSKVNPPLKQAFPSPQFSARSFLMSI